MTWIILSLLTAVAVATRDISVKTYQDLDTLEVAGIELFWSLPFFIFGFFLVPVPQLDVYFWKGFFWSLPLNSIPYFLYLYAIKKSPISLSVPFLSFSPLFMILTGYLILGESVTLWGFLGVILVVSGGYVLNMQHISKGFFEPVKALFNELGSVLMLLVAAFFSIAAVYGKMAILHSSPLYFSYYFFLVLNCLMFIGLVFCNKVSFKTLFIHHRRGLWLGGLLVSHVTTHCMAIALNTAVYMIALKRSSILITIVLSWIFLQEGQRVNRGTGALLMFIGLVIITVLG